ncbi:MAG: twin-arginine translocase subunit TatC [Burkholderiales bacterium]|nr:MAG: twin-arginine translocase subunit TatC [Burkholderiales bacterium]
MSEEQAPEQEETFISHLVELRDRLIRALMVVLVLFVVAFYFAGDIYQFLSIPIYKALPPGAKLVSTDLAGSFFTLTKVAFVCAFLAALPIVLYQAWAFVAPGLYEHEKKFVFPLMVSSVFFLLAGISFAYYFVLPAAFKFFLYFAQSAGADPMQDIQKYWDFTLALFFGFGLTFEAPVVEILLVKLGMVSIEQLRKSRRYVVVGAFVVAAVITPPDVLSQFMLAIPLILLYELGIFMAGFIRARSRAPDGEDEAADGSASAEAPDDTARSG